MNRFAPPLVAIVAFVAVACGGGESSSGPTTSSSAAPVVPVGASPSASVDVASGVTAGVTVQACDLLTEEDIQEVTGLTIAEATAEKTMGVFENGCEWSLEGEAASSATAITLGILVPGGRAMWERSFKPYGEEMGMEDLEGVGDEAQLGDIDDVIAVQGDALVSLQFLGTFGLPDDLSVELTKRVLEHLAPG